MDSSLTKQIRQSMESVCRAAPHLDLSYFKELWTAFLTDPPQPGIRYVAVLGNGVPEIYLRVCGLAPVYLFGGGIVSNALSDEFFPPISDPAFKSAVGLLLSRELPLLRGINTVAMAAPNVDAIKVQAYLRREGFTVL